MRGRVVVGLVAGALLAAGCSSPVSSSTGSNFVSGDGTITVLSPAQRRAPVEVAGQTLDGARFDLASLRGHAVVLNVWGSWCPPCRKEAPDLQAARTKLAPSGVGFLGIAVRDQADTALAMQRSFGITYPSLLDDGGNLLLALRGAVSPSAVPSTLVLDAHGRVAAAVSGPVTTQTLVDLVDQVTAS
jgi:thiol-disulfide isomerase/thioredoxin